MSSWLASPYRIVGIYLGGRNRACSDGNLSSSWITTVTGQGWRFMPIWVGYQSPCNAHTDVTKLNLDPATAAAEGTDEANLAATRAAYFRLGAGSPIYFDMENYARDLSTTAGQSCITAVQTFVSAWVDQLHARGYVAGFYSSGSSGITDEVNIVKNGLTYHVPDQLWFAHWNDVATVWGNPYVAPDTLWASHQRHHQYHGGHNESWGGVTINIDNDVSDGATASG
jgi:hypothetical protein